MSDVLDDLLFSSRRTPAEAAALRARLDEDPALRDALARWEAAGAALRARLDDVLPDRRLLVLHVLDARGEPLSDAERAALAAGRADLDRAFDVYPALRDVARQIGSECAAFDAAWAAHAAPAPGRAAPVRPPVRPRAHRLVRWTMRAGVALALAAFVAVGVLVTQRDDAMRTVEADAPTLVTLGGGTTARLAAGARLTYPDPDVATTLRRPVRLDGGAFFDVAPQAEPFVVETATARATVLGTRFGVRADAAMTEVVLVTGHVQVASAGAPERPVALAPGEASRVAAGALPSTPAAVDLEAQLAWTGLFVFRATPAAALAGRLAAHYGVPVTVAGALAAEPVTGTFERTQPLPEVLAAVAATLGADVVPAGDGYRLE